MRTWYSLSLSSFLDYLNTIDKTGQIKFTMEIAGNTGLEFFDLKLRISEGKIRVDGQLNPLIVLAIPHLTPTTQKTTYATYLEVLPFD